jgi:hypothetical protein
MNAFNLYEAYAAVYDEELRSEILNIEEDFAFIDELSDSELDDVMEEILSEGIELSECFEAFDEVLSEAKVTSSEDREESAKTKVTKGQGSVMAAKQRVAARKAQRRAERVERIKSSAKRAAEKVRTTAAGVASAAAGGASEAGRKAKEGVKKVGGKLAAAKEKLKGFIKSGRKAVAGGLRGLAAKVEPKEKSSKKDTSTQRTPSGSYRGQGVGQRERVGGEVKQTKTVSTPNKERIAAAREKLSKAAAGTSARGVRFAAPGGGVASTRANTGRKEALGKFRKKVGLSDHYEYVLDSIFEDMINEGYVNDYETALYVVESLSESDLDYILESYDSYLTEETEIVDLYDVVLEHLLDEGYADTEEAATVIMANMSEEWREEILEAEEKKDEETSKTGLRGDETKKMPKGWKPTGPKLRYGERPGWHR